MKIGVLALQGAVREHVRMLEQSGVEAVPVKRNHELEGLDGLVIPGGESTTISKLMHQYDLMEPVKEMGRKGRPLFGTCAGLILLAKRIEGMEGSHLGLMDITVRRNAFGRQRESFEARLDVKGVAEDYEAVFIRAPYISEAGPEVDVLSALEGRTVIVRQGPFLGASFHPELTEDHRLHSYFAEMVKESRTEKTNTV
ncbi:pyridoxal 5'-phosphate synthase glutaminase subunit PdxT [Paludifilum halophilum]|uniref:Pyridoxal 5'-phosphate synthase subunit PdxT n=1 Tax=Paludifilum halophilum TaxID=1642702 RepID=A0A235B6P2_9BACL|nr:pyridoxal 5'-phosphate synthase glutaminase subunit PdxT [Paludifilum halophilum]OYD07902.1 pyridoxal 5'-phosphate synthase glutaminase subunit PdxT [Paludifilum halophilum]